jgi:rSAM/selenodomain-associated transferase 1
MEFGDATILVFCRAPIAGKVKTRLIPSLGEEGAAKLHAELATRMIEEAADAELASVELWCDPDDSDVFFDSFKSRGVELRIQQGGDLGERMSNAIAASLEGGASRTVLVGTDCPPVDAAYLRRALSALTDHDAVIGPAEDGGYGLIGLKEADRRLFEDIAWGSDKVCASTCIRFNERRLRWSLLPLIWDVDRPEDVLRYRRFRTADRVQV